MRPLILGREFLFENELKVYYAKTGDCRLDYKQEELIATLESQDELTLTLKGGVYIPGRTVAVLNICHATRVEEDPKATQDIGCLQQGGGAALIQTKQQFPQPKR